MQGDYQAYSEYKDPELLWLKYVPSHWIVSKFAYVKTVLTDFTANGSFADLKKNVVYRDVPSYARLVRLTDLRVDLENENGVWIDEDAYNYLGKSALFGGEFLLANVGAYAGLFYQMPNNKGYASLAPNMFMAKFDDSKILREFMAYVGQSHSANEQLKLNATASSAQPKLNKDDFKSVRFTYPPIEEQQKIASFLDHETAKIDKLIEKQQQLIKLLKEKRQAAISHAVTKGLNPNAPMRDSGVEWLGEVPEHWELMMTKFMFFLQRGHDLSSDKFKDGSYPVYGSNGVIGFHDQLTTRAPSLTVGRSGSVGEVNYIENDFWAHNTSLFLKYCINSDVKFIYYLLLAMDIKSLSSGSAVGTLDRNNIHVRYVAVPPQKNQIEIVRYLDNKLLEFDRLNNKALDLIKLMQERRTALISAAVTGKIDVRNWQSPNTNNTLEEAKA